MEATSIKALAIALNPKRGLTIRRGICASTVRDVRDGIVRYAVFIDGCDSMAGEFQTPIDEWRRAARKAMEQGAKAYVLGGR